MRCCSAMAVAAWMVLLLLCCPAAQAHKASDGYLQLDATAGGTQVRVDLALRDLDVALDLDADADGKLTWGEIRAAWPGIERYVAQRLRVAGCTLGPAEHALERRVDGAYAALTFKSSCVLQADPAIEYRMLGDVDPTHRGIASITIQGAPVAVRVLTPGSAAEATTPTADAHRQGFLIEGVHHIVGGYDHVLFLLCLLLPSVMVRTPKGWRPVERIGQALWPIFGIVTAFTVAHSITLGLAASKLVSLPPSFIEPAIAVTIVLAALDNIRTIFHGRRAIVTFFFGLIHGFGFAGVLGELNLPTAQFAWALFQFNVGLELGQLLIVAIAASVLFLLRRQRAYPAVVIRGASFAAMLIGVLWFIERTANVSLLPMLSN